MSSPAPQRLVSIDALRGFDMFWIAGGAAAFSGLANLSGLDFMHAWSEQLEHVEWDGFHFWDHSSTSSGMASTSGT